MRGHVRSNRPSGRQGPAATTTGARRPDNASYPQSLVPYLVPGWIGSDFAGGESSTDPEPQAGATYHASYYFWGGRVWLLGAILWEGLDPTFDQPATVISAALPEEIRPEVTQTVRLWTRDTDGASVAVWYWDTLVHPDGLWEIVPRASAPVLPDRDLWDGSSPIFMLDPMSWPQPGEVISDPRVDPSLDLADYLDPTQVIPGANGARLVQGGGRIHGEGSIITIAVTSFLLSVALPIPWRPIANNFLQGRQRALKLPILGDPERAWQSFVNYPIFGNYLGFWSLDNENPHFSYPTGGSGPPFFGFAPAGVEFVLDDSVGWRGGELGGVSAPGASEVGQGPRGVVVRPQTKTPL